MAKEVTDPALIAALEGGPASGPKEVTDPHVLAKLNGQQAPTTYGGKFLDLVKSIPGGLVSGFSEAASALGRATQAEMGQEVDAPSPEQGAALMQQHITGQLPEPQGNWGKVGAAIGNTMGNPASWVGPGGIALKTATNIGSSVAGETARQALEGTKWEVPGSIAASVAGGAIPTMRPAGVRIPTTDELKAAAKAGYREAQATGMKVEGQDVGRAAALIKDHLERQGINAEDAKNTFAKLDRIINAPPGSTVDVNGFRTIQRGFGNVEKDAKNPITGAYTTESLAALQARQGLGYYMENAPRFGANVTGDAEQAVGLIKDANGNYASRARANILDTKLDDAAIQAAAANSGQNLANRTRQKVASILTNRKLSSQYKPDEIAQAYRVVEGTKTGNSARRIANFLGAGGGMGQLNAMTVGGGIGGALGMYGDGDLSGAGYGGTAGAAGVAIAGALAKGVHNKSVLRQARILSETIRSNSPLAKQMAQEGNPRRGETISAIARALLAR